MTRAKTKILEYVGEHGPVFMTQDGDVDLVFAPGEPVEVDADLAERLLLQDTFREVKKSGS